MPVDALSSSRQGTPGTSWRPSGYRSATFRSTLLEDWYVLICELSKLCKVYICIHLIQAIFLHHKYTSLPIQKKPHLCWKFFAPDNRLGQRWDSRPQTRSLSSALHIGHCTDELLMDHNMFCGFSVSPVSLWTSNTSSWQPTSHDLEIRLIYAVPSPLGSVSRTIFVKSRLFMISWTFHHTSSISSKYPLSTGIGKCPILGLLDITL